MHNEPGSESDYDPSSDIEINQTDIIYTERKPSWKRKRINSIDDNDTDTYTPIEYFKNLKIDYPGIDTVDFLHIYERDDRVDIWILEEAHKIVGILTQENKKIRFEKVYNMLLSSIENKRVNDELMSEDDGDDGDDELDDTRVSRPIDLASVLFTLFGNESLSEDTSDDVLLSDDDPMSRFKKILSSITNNKNDKRESTLTFFKSLNKDTQEYYLGLINDMKSKHKDLNSKDIPYLLHISEANIDTVTKNYIFDQVVSFQTMSSSSSEYNKRHNLIQTIQSLPLGKLADQPKALIDATLEYNAIHHRRKSKKIKLSEPTKIMKYLDKVKADMDDVIYGHEETKNQTLRLISSMISNGTSKGGNCFAMEGPPGVGKTQIAGEIAKALGRPCVKINMGGASNGDDFVGHGYTYEGSTPGKIVTSLIESKCMNPVLIFDELDKISQTAKGQEINNILLHITDATQNASFTDKYLTGINIDLSNALMIFSFNDSRNISPILLDRMKIIKVEGYKAEDKLTIAKRHLIPCINKGLGYPDSDVGFESNLLKDIINQYTFEGGVRHLKELLTDIIMEINLRKMTNTNIDGIHPCDIKIVTKKMVKNDLFKDKQYIQHTMPSEINQVGLVNGLWANNYGVGGLIPIQAHIIPSSNKFDLQLTGMQGDVMKESMLVAKTVAWELLPTARKEELMVGWKKHGPTGIHIHCPDGSTPKDGPSAGGAITTCLLSLLTNSEVDQTYAMTGEINLKGDITAIGGLEEKVFGALTAGIKTVLYPLENQRDADKIIKKYPHLFDKTNDSPEHITIIPISNISDILEKVLIKKT